MRGRIAVVGALAGALMSAPPQPVRSSGALRPSERAQTRAVAHKPGGRVVSTHVTPRARLFGVGHTALEPTIGVTRSATLFFTAMEKSTRIEVLRSGDGGPSWEVVSPSVGGQNAHLVSVDPYLHVDADTGRVFTVDLTVACSFLSFSDDEGESWITNPLGCGRPINDHQTLFTGPPASSTLPLYPNVVYYCFNDVAASTCTKSLDGGVTFFPTGGEPFPVETYESGSPCPGIHGHGVVADDGTVLLPKAHCGEPWLAISRDEGLTWRRVRVAPGGAAGPGLDPAVAVDSAGNIYYVWIRADDRLPYMSTSTDGGETWSRPIMVGAPRVKEANLATIATSPSGRVAIAYTGSENSLYQRCKDDGCRGEAIQPRTPTWHGYLAVTDEPLGRDPLLYTARVNDRVDPLVRGGCGPGRCSWMVDFIDVQFGPRGVPWATFVDGYVPPDAEDLEVGEGLVATLVLPRAER